MLEIIAKYWLNFLLSAIAGGLTFVCKKIWNMYKNEKNHQKTKEQQEFYQGIQDTIKEVGLESKKGDAVLQDQITILKGGILSIQRKNFKQECKELLREGHEITLEEFQAIDEDHEIYHSLGGNHDGDTLFEMVKRKATNNITD